MLQFELRGDRSVVASRASSAERGTHGGEVCWFCAHPSVSNSGKPFPGHDVHLMLDRDLFARGGQLAARVRAFRVDASCSHRTSWSRGHRRRDESFRR